MSIKTPPLRNAKNWKNHLVSPERKRRDLGGKENSLIVQRPKKNAREPKALGRFFVRVNNQAWALQGSKISTEGAGRADVVDEVAGAVEREQVAAWAVEPLVAAEPAGELPHRTVSCCWS